MSFVAASLIFGAACTTMDEQQGQEQVQQQVQQQGQEQIQQQGQEQIQEQSQEQIQQQAQEQGKADQNAPTLSPDMESANAFVYLRDGSIGVEATLDLPSGPFEPFTIDVVVVAGTQSENYCQADTILPNVPQKLSCAFLEVPHTSVTQVAIIAGRGAITMSCIRLNTSTTIESRFGCLVD